MNTFQVEHDVEGFRIRFRIIKDERIVFGGIIEKDGSSHWWTIDSSLHFCGPNTMTSFFQALMQCYVIANEHFDEVKDDVEKFKKNGFPNAKI